MTPSVPRGVLFSPRVAAASICPRNARTTPLQEPALTRTSFCFAYGRAPGDLRSKKPARVWEWVPNPRGHIFFFVIMKVFGGVDPFYKKGPQKKRWKKAEEKSNRAFLAFFPLPW